MVYKFATNAEMDLHISKSGKNFDRNKQNHAVPTSMKKAKTFLDDEYLRDLTCASDDQYFYFKCLCYHSFKKNEPPHKLQVALCLVSGVVKLACSRRSDSGEQCEVKRSAKK